MLEKYYIVRLSGLYGHTGCVGKGNVNFVEMMIKLAHEKDEIKVINDQFLTPTSTIDVSKKLFELIQTKKFGLYHMTNTGSCSWYEFACATFELVGLKPNIRPVSSTEFPAKARRPNYSVLSTVRIKEVDLPPLRPWREALKSYLFEKGEVMIKE